MATGKMSKEGEAPKLEYARYSQLSPYLYVSGHTHRRETLTAVADVVTRWSERYPSGAWYAISGRRSEDGRITIGLEFMPNDAAMSELRAELEPLLGPVVFMGVQYDVEAGTGKGKLLTDG